MSIQPFPSLAASGSSRPSWRNRVSAWILPFVALGFVACVILRLVVAHFTTRGPWVALALVVFAPIGLMLGVLALPELLRKLRAIKP